MAETTIEWTDHSINPIRAKHIETGAVGHYCEKISSGCANCYASRMQSRFQMPPFSSRTAQLVRRSPESEIVINEELTVWLDYSKLGEVLRRKKPTKYFWCDMTDMFGWWVPEEWIDKCFATMALTPQHTHMVLTKRPERAAKYLYEDPEYLMAAEELIHQCGQDPVLSDLQRDAGWRWEVYRDEEDGKDGNLEYHGTLPLPNVWIGTSVENQRAAVDRLDYLQQCEAAIRFVSGEPLLDSVDLTPWLDFIDWVIVGGESGPKARANNLENMANLQNQCYAAGVAYFGKQVGTSVVLDYYGVDDELRDWMLDRGEVMQPTDGGYVKWDHATFGQPNPNAIIQWKPKDKKGVETSEWPESMRVREFPTPTPAVTSEE